MITMVTIKTKYATPLSQLHHPFYLLYLLDLSLSWVFPLPPSILPSFIILIIIVYYLHIITIKKLMNLDHLTCYHCHAYFVSINGLNAGAGPTFDSICTICKSFSSIL